MKKIVFSIGLSIVIFCSCKEDNINKPYGPNDGVAPGKVTNLTYESTPGGATIKYTNPSDDDLLYVKASYTLSTGQQMEERVSGYENSLQVVGFNDITEKEVTLRAVDRHENVGPPVTFKVTPGVSPLVSAYETLDLRVAFGGVYVELENETKGNLIIEVEAKDDLGIWRNYNTVYTSKKSVLFATRGFNLAEREFGVRIRDRWNNVSQTMIRTFTPLEDYQLVKSHFRAVSLPNDNPMGGWGHVLANAWDGSHVWDPDAAGINDYAHSPDGWAGPFPTSVTLDLGVTKKLSRYIYYQRQGTGYLWLDGDAKTWEVYGRADTPPADGSWDGWTLLCSNENIEPLGASSTEKIELAKKGMEFDILDSPQVKYIRIKFLTSYGPRLFFSELTFFGQV